MEADVAVHSPTTQFHAQMMNVSRTLAAYSRSAVHVCFLPSIPFSSLPFPTEQISHCVWEVICCYCQLTEGAVNVFGAN